MKRTLFLALAALLTLSVSAKSIVLTLNDAKGTRIYYKLGTGVNPKMVINDDGTFTMNDAEYSFTNLASFAYSTTDYTGEANTVDAIITVESDKLQMGGAVKVYDLNGRLVRTTDGGINLSGLPSGTYVISNGISIVKMMKR